MTERVCKNGGRGFTLIELVTTLGIAAVLFLALGDAVYISTRALPSKTDAMQASVPAAQAIDQIAGEIESAMYISQMTGTSISFTVADRDGDGLPERITYSWSGVAGDPLVRTFNGTAWTVVDTVMSFNLTPSVQYVSETYPNPGTEDLTPSVLQDLTATTNLGTQSMGSSNSTNYAQYFQPTASALGTDVIGWRPATVTLPAMKNQTPGTYRVQMAPGTAQLVPGLPIFEEHQMIATNLTGSLVAQTYTFTTLLRQSVGNAMCFNIMWDSGQGPGKFQSNSSYGGMAKTQNSPTSWQADPNHALNAQLLGYPMRASGTSTATTGYLQTMAIAMTAGNANGPVMQTSVLSANHPEIVDGMWEAKFDRDPTHLDVNGDGTMDWVGSAGYSATSVSGGVWTSSAESLTTMPASNFAGMTVVDVRLQSVVAGATAGVSIAAATSGNQCVPLTFALVLQGDGTQTLTVSEATGSSTTAILMVYTLLPAQPTDLHVIIDPSGLGAAVSVNGAQRGSLPITRATISGVTHGMTLFGSGGTNGAKFSYARVRSLKATP
jgi:prepilin-type N-terminal cleavage/methylation domain-containing protein